VGSCDSDDGFFLNLPGSQAVDRPSRRSRPSPFARTACPVSRPHGRWRLPGPSPTRCRHIVSGGGRGSRGTTHFSYESRHLKKKPPTQTCIPAPTLPVDDAEFMRGVHHARLGCRVVAHSWGSRGQGTPQSPHDGRASEGVIGRRSSRPDPRVRTRGVAAPGCGAGPRMRCRVAGGRGEGEGLREGDAGKAGSGEWHARPFIRVAPVVSRSFRPSRPSRRVAIR